MNLPPELTQFRSRNPLIDDDRGNGRVALRRILQQTDLFRMAAVGPTGKAFNYADGEPSISNSAALA